MGRLLSGTTTSTVPSVGTTGIGSLEAGVALAVNDLVLTGPTGKGYPANTIDYAAIGNGATQIVAQTSDGSPLLHGGRYGVLQGADGAIYFTTPYSSNAGCKVTRYKADGTGAVTVTISTDANPLVSPFLLQLTNGNMAVVYGLGTAPIAWRRAIINPSLGIVLADSAIENGYGTNPRGMHAVALSGGGFAVCYHYATNDTLQRLVVYDNAGTAIVGPASIHTWTGSINAVRTNMVQLSNGNLAIACNSMCSTSQGTYHAIHNAATGATVKAMTQLATLATTSNKPDLSTFGSTYCVARCDDGVNWKAWVLDLAGNVQGAGYTSTSAAGSNYNQSKLMNDGVAYYLVASIDGAASVLKLPITGTGYVRTAVSAITASVTSRDAFIERGMLVLVQCMSSTNKNNYVVIDLATLVAMTTATDFGAAPASANNGAFMTAIPGGDFTFIAVFDVSGNASSSMYVGKYANSSVAGVALAAAATGSTVTLAEGIGTYDINPIKGVSAKAFDHSSATIIGNKGTLTLNAALLKGL